MSEPIRIVALGDSITYGAGHADVTEPTTFRMLVGRMLGQRLGRPVEVANAGVNGDIVPLALQRLDRDVIDRRPDVVTVMFGGNEAGYYRPETNGFADTPRVDLDAFGDAMGQVVDRVLAAGAAVVLMTPPTMTEAYWGMELEPYQEHGINFLVTQYAQRVRDVAGAKGVSLVDVYAAFERDGSTRPFFADGLHPDTRGHRFIAELLVEPLAAAIADRECER